MNIATFVSGGEVFVNRECIKRYAFKKAPAWDRSALLPVICAQVAAAVDSSAHLAVLNASRPTAA